MWMYWKKKCSKCEYVYREYDNNKWHFQQLKPFCVLAGDREALWALSWRGAWGGVMDQRRYGGCQLHRTSGRPSLSDHVLVLVCGHFFCWWNGLIFLSWLCGWLPRKVRTALEVGNSSWNHNVNIFLFLLGNFLISCHIVCLYLHVLKSV